MDKMRFVFPCEAYEQRAVYYIQEFIGHGSAINGTGGLDRFLRDSTYGAWLEKVRADTDLANVPEGRSPGYTYFYVRESDGELVGMINIRLALVGDFMREQGGHFGYSVRPTQRGKGYATAMLRGALAFCSAIGMNDFVVGCHKANPASAGVITNCGGVLEAEFYSGYYGQVVQRYRIHL